MRSEVIELKSFGFKNNLHSLGLTGTEIDFLVSFKFFLRTRNAAHRIGNINLSYFSTFALAYVGKVKSHSHSIVTELARFQIVEGKCGVRQSVSEGESDALPFALRVFEIIAAITLEDSFIIWYMHTFSVTRSPYRFTFRRFVIACITRIVNKIAFK